MCEYVNELRLWWCPTTNIPTSRKAYEPQAPTFHVLFLYICVFTGTSPSTWICISCTLVAI